MNCEKCQDKGVVIREMEVRKQEWESYQEYLKRMKGFATYCGCELGMKIEFLHRKADQIAKSKKEP